MLRNKMQRDLSEHKHDKEYITIIQPSTQQIHKYYFINISLLCTFAACFDPAGSSSGKYS
jgi:hypothetical protein